MHACHYIEKKKQIMFVYIYEEYMGRYMCACVGVYVMSMEKKIEKS